jgi:chorismate mutase
MGWVPEEQYRELAAENKMLQQKISQQDGIIRRLQTLMNEKGLDQSRALEVFRDLIDRQGQEFQKLMNALSQTNASDE